jgi:hypothetical protein
MSTNQAMTTDTVKYSTQLPPELIKWAKLYALSNDIKDYEVVQAAVEEFKARREQGASQKVQLFEMVP